MSYVPFGALPQMQQQRAMQGGFRGMPMGTTGSQASSQAANLRSSALAGQQRMSGGMDVFNPDTSQLEHYAGQQADPIQALQRAAMMGVQPTNNYEASMRSMAFNPGPSGGTSQYNPMQMTGAQDVTVGGPVIGGAEAYAQRTNPVMHPNLPRSALQPLASEMNPNSTMFARLNQQQSPLLNKLLQ